MGCFVVTEFLLTSVSRGPSAIAELLVLVVKIRPIVVGWYTFETQCISDPLFSISQGTLQWQPILRRPSLFHVSRPLNEDFEEFTP